MLNAFSNWLRENIPIISSSWAAVQMITNLALIPMAPVETQNILPQSAVEEQQSQPVMFITPESVEEAVEKNNKARELYELSSNSLDAIDVARESEEENEISEGEDLIASGNGPLPEEEDEMKSLDEAMACFEEYYYSHGQPQELTQELSAY